MVVDEHVVSLIRATLTYTAVVIASASHVVSLISATLTYTAVVFTYDTRDVPTSTCAAT